MSAMAAHWDAKPASVSTTNPAIARENDAPWIYPVSRDAAELSVDSKGTLMYSSAHSCMYRT